MLVGGCGPAGWTVAEAEAPPPLDVPTNQTLIQKKGFVQTIFPGTLNVYIHQ